MTTCRNLCRRKVGKARPEESLASRLQLATAGAVNPKARHGGPGKHVSLLLASWQESTRLRVHVEPKSERESWHWLCTSLC